MSEKEDRHSLDLSPEYYIEKWSAMAIPATSIDRDLAAASVLDTYRFLQLRTPTIVFISEPNSAVEIFLRYKLMESNKYNYGIRLQPQISRKQAVQLERQLGLELSRTFTDKLLHHLTNSVRSQIGNQVESELWRYIENPIRQNIKPSYAHQFHNWIDFWDWCCHAGKLDFCISELGAVYDLERWQIFKNSIATCASIFPFSHVCAIVDRDIITASGNVGSTHSIK